MGQHTRSNKDHEGDTRRNEPEIPEHDSAQRPHNPLKINGPSSQFYRYEMAVNLVQ